MRILFFLVACLSLLLQQSVVQADDGILGNEPKFSKIVLESLKLRSQLIAGEFEYKISFKRSGDEFLSSVQKGTFAYDDRTNNSLHVYTKSIRDPNSPSNVTTTIEGGVFFPPPVKSLLIRSNVVASEMPMNSWRDSSLFKPFEFRAFGYALLGDIEKKSDFENVLMNHLSVSDDNIEKISPTSEPEQHATQTRKSSFNYGGSIITIDLDRELWPVKQKFEQANSYKDQSGSRKQGKVVLVSGTEIELDNFQGRWIPKEVTIRSPNGQSTIQFNWTKLNANTEDMQISISRAKDIAFIHEQKLSKLPSLLDQEK